MLGILEAPAPGHNDLGLGQGHAFLDFLHGADKAAGPGARQGGQLHPDDLALLGMRLGQALEDAGPGRGHLGKGAGGDDGGHDVAAEGRAGLEQKALFRVDGKRGAVRGEAGFKRRRHLGDKGPARIGGPGQNDFRLKFPGDFRQGRSVGLFDKVSQWRRSRPGTPGQRRR